MLICGWKEAVSKENDLTRVPKQQNTLPEEIQDLLLKDLNIMITSKDVNFSYQIKKEEMSAKLFTTHCVRIHLSKFKK